ncbi:MAG: asparagine synthase (glutamine-hydrolyzing), partial [Solirubrobacteraceae bacterium]
MPTDRTTLRAMTDAMIHRGPDDHGHVIEPGVALGARRLSIIDVPNGAQPIANEDASVWTVFNGEIYNFMELRSSLARDGHVLSTHGDTETIVHLYEQYGVEFAKRLRGMFAIAVWDRAKRRLILARDRMGVKPLYYATGPFGLAFASEVKSLIAGGLVDPELDPLGAELFLAWGYVPGPNTLFKGVRKLMPATVLVWEDGGIRDERTYWDPDGLSNRDPSSSWTEDGERLLELLRTSVRARMVSEVPIGVMLSGGIDSSLIATLMTEVSSRPLKTFSVGFVEDAGSNELASARAVARRLGSEHHELSTSALEYDHVFDEALWHMEEPVADLSPLGFFVLSQLARESVTVALSGQGADELLGGYRKHQFAAAAYPLARVPGVTRLLASSTRWLTSESSVGRGLTALSSADPAERQQAMSRVFSAGHRLELLESDFREQAAEHAIAAGVHKHLTSASSSPLAQTLDLDTRMALVDNMLLYFDKMSMATSLEVRVPFMDHDVVTFCRGLPDSRKVWLLRRK